MRASLHRLASGHRPRLGTAVPRVLCLAAWCGLASGCRREPPPPATLPAGVQVAITVDTPASAVRSLLELLSAHLDALARGDRRAADAYRNLVAEKLTARRHIMTRYREIARPFDKDEATVLRSISESWAAIIAYYADGIERDRISLTGLAGDADQAVVDVPARGSVGDALIRVACERDDAGNWSIVALELAPPSEAASQPSSDGRVGGVAGDRK
jgi:hypothetical protein